MIGNSLTRRIFLFVVFVSALFFQTQLFASTLAYWGFENNYLDSSGGHDLNVYGSPVPGFASNTNSSAPGDYYLNKPDGTYLQVNDDYKGPANNFTLELFFKTTDAEAAIINNYRHSTGGVGLSVGGWWLGLREGQIQISIRSGNDLSTRKVAVTSELYNDDAWHHVAFSLSSDNLLKGYIDGELFDTIETYGISPDRRSIVIGRQNVDSGTNTSFYDGAIDEIRLSEGVLEPSQFLLSNPVPEPMTIFLLCAGLLGTAFRKRMRR